jgi:hypothetical protein
MKLYERVKGKDWKYSCYTDITWFFVLFCFVFGDRVSYVAQGSLELSIHSASSCLSLLSSGITGMHHCAHLSFRVSF